MESLEIGYSFISTVVPKPRRSGCPASAPSPPRPGDLAPTMLVPVDEMSIASRESSVLTEITSESEIRRLDEIVCERPMEIRFGDAIEGKSGGVEAVDESVCDRPILGPGMVFEEDKGQPTSRKSFKTDKTSTKRKRDHIGEQSLLLTEPPRQSIRNRINIEYPKIKDPPTTSASLPAKKKRKEKKSRTEMAGPLRDSSKEGKADKRNARRKERKERDAQAAGSVLKKRMVAKAFPPSIGTSRLNHDQSYGSMEAMDLVLPGHTSSTRLGMSLQERLQAKGRKRTSKVLRAKKAVPDDEIPLLEVHTVDCPEDEKRGIPSRVFTHVMRLVAGLPAMQPTASRTKRRVPAHRPSAWAKSRQELCEALPYYRAFQSGLYLSQGVAFGYLLDGFPAPRDVCAHNARVIISHGGGQCVRPTLNDGTTLPPVLAGDQSTTDFRVAALVRAWQRRIPLVLIAGSGYKLLPFKLKLNASYAVLGWYWVSLVWTEAEPVARGIKRPIGRKWYKRVKVRFDWVESQGQPWWERPAGLAPKTFLNPDEVALSPQAKRISVSALTQDVDQRRDPLPYIPPRHSRSSSMDSDISHVSSDSERDFVNCQLSDTHNTQSRLRPGKQIKHDVKVPIKEISSYRTAVIGNKTAALDALMVPRLPGEYCLARFEDTVEARDADVPFSSLLRTCEHCHQSSPKIYAEGWICLDTTCKAYWLLATSIGLLPIPPGMKLSYETTFLNPAPTPATARPPYEIVPPEPEGGIPTESGSNDSAGSRGLWRGWVCNNCGRANCRFRWEAWQCLECNRLLAPIDPHSAAIPARSLLSRNSAMFGDPRLDPQSGISVQVRRISNPSATVMVYTLPNQIGTIYHVINDCTEFADGIFDRYQRQAANTRVPLFQRRPLNAHQIKGELLAQHFAVNSGVSYKYNVDSCSLSFDESPSCVKDALKAITIRTEKIVGGLIDFNEVLSVLYREGQKMSWHDDGEPGLGPIVAGLSLGSDAIISWRKKSAHTASNAPFNKGVPDPRKEPTPSIALSLTTSHGDIVLMQGRDMQKKYVHRVIPSGFRVAATARVIGK